MYQQDSYKTDSTQQENSQEEVEELPTYGDLEEQERSNPNSRFGRWRSWIEKRAAERYNDMTEEERFRQRERGWGESIDTDVTDQAPPSMAAIASPTSAQLSAQRIGDTRLSIYEFGSRFIPHSASPIRSLISLLDDRYLLLGGPDGLGFLDVFPENQLMAADSDSIVHPLEGAKRRDIWTGEAIYQMEVVESYSDHQGGLQGVLLALVGPDETEQDKDSIRSVRMYNMASVYSLVRWMASHPDAKPLAIHPPKGWTHQHSTSRRLQRHGTHNITKSLKNMVIDPQNGRPMTPTVSTSSLKSPSIASERSPPKHQETQDSAESWDMVDTVEDLPLRWATDYVNLAGTGSRLASTSVLFFELWRNEGINARGTSMLAVATKTSILLYETPKGERSFRFIKEFYTPIPAKSANFIQQTNQDTIRATPVHPEGERLRKERPVSRTYDGSVTSSPRARRISTPGDSSYGSQLSLFVIFEKKAGLIRIVDSSVSELELWDDGGRPPSPIHTLSSPTSIHSLHSASVIRRSIQDNLTFGKDKSPWYPLVTMEIPYPNDSNPPSFNASKTILIISRGTQSHILDSPLRMPMGNYPPLRVVRWHTMPFNITARLSMVEGKEPRLQLVAFSDRGIEVAETTVDFLFRPPDLGQTDGKGKGKNKSISVLSEPLVRAQHLSLETTKYLVRGGLWHTLDMTSGQPELKSPVSSVGEAPSLTISRLEKGQGIYACVQRGLEDYRVLWLGDEALADS
ncbi:hypothetical protein FRB91_010667 [Serendipita sp. 411]|nr:hypothetical protein FRC16_010352 [Serendipita sp. 398]KAG8825708.1 hypothetical protein FRC19_010698 [Serendipita sp. 401]KAG8857899.1 hypothetical protein FRB91_010667 [Serendipita sp. 411]KAG9056284.1 hypothetical protein FS842_011173 [Serendipita sp. 407]